FAGIRLGRPSPNPFRTAMTATLELSSERLVSAFVVDCSGRRVRSLFAEPRAGTSEVTWDGARDDRTHAAPGLYFLYVRAGQTQVVRKLALTRGSDPVGGGHTGRGARRPGKSRCVCRCSSPPTGRYPSCLDDRKKTTSVLRWPQSRRSGMIASQDAAVARR